MKKRLKRAEIVKIPLKRALDSLFQPQCGIIPPLNGEKPNMVTLGMIPEEDSYDFTAYDLCRMCFGCVDSLRVRRHGHTEAPTGLDALQAESVQPKNYNVVDYSVRVPSNLTISEANSYYPVADIVWRGDALGDRHMQVAKIFQDSLERAIPNVTQLAACTTWNSMLAL